MNGTTFLSGTFSYTNSITPATHKTTKNTSATLSNVSVFLFVVGGIE